MPTGIIDYEYKSVHRTVWSIFIPHDITLKLNGLPVQPYEYVAF